MRRDAHSNWAVSGRPFFFRAPILFVIGRSLDTLADRFGVTYTVTRTPWGDKATIYHVHWSSELVARAVLRGDQVREVLVYRLRDRRRGIASALYQRIETDLGKPLLPSRVTSAVWRKFWDSRRRES